NLSSLANSKQLLINSIFYVITIPTDDKEPCEQLTVKQVTPKNFVNKIKHNVLLVCKKNIFGIKNKLKNVNKIAIHKNDIFKSQCPPNLIHSNPSNCTLQLPCEHCTSWYPTTEPTQWHGPLRREPCNLTGIYLIKFGNETDMANLSHFRKPSFPFPNPRWYNHDLNILLSRKLSLWN
uniref:Uncharacterized protein n=1 Tax=Glossina palpalis gambiensis TaxID=67801 RepID=A0A1B0BLK1_9MUSC